MRASGRTVTTRKVTIEMIALGQLQGMMRSNKTAQESDETINKQYMKNNEGMVKGSGNRGHDSYI